MQAHDQAEQERAQGQHHAQRLETVQFGVGIDGRLAIGAHVSGLLRRRPHCAPAPGMRRDPNMAKRGQDRPRVWQAMPSVSWVTPVARVHALRGRPKDCGVAPTANGEIRAACVHGLRACHAAFTLRAIAIWE